MVINEEAFSERYKKLNPQQKAAVDSIEGPVMVIAGPGTGKTEVLSMRIANLLRSEAQVKPHEILCLTFTDEAGINMRKRLQKIIYEEAHKVNIYTFHAFCNSIIQRFPEQFGMRDLQPISELENMELLYGMIEALPEGHALRRLKGDLYYDARNLSNLFALMKSEGWTPSYVQAAIDLYIADLPNRESYIYKRANAKKDIKAGDPKTEDIRKETERMERTRAAAALFDEYQRRMEQSGRYDFNDMILWVLNAFKRDEDFLRINQERFQYILVDEFQDTSGAQSELLTLLADFWNTPNVFVVGDDDQSIFEFQGARLRNIIDFYERYRADIKVIVLKENYRSAQPVIDKSMLLIGNNEQRLIYQIKDLQLDKTIVSANDRFQHTDELPPPVITEYYNLLHEEAEIVRQIERLQGQGVPLREVAVLYAQHKQAANIISLLEKKRIPYWVKKPVNILDLPLVQQLLYLFQYLQQEMKTSFSGEEILFQLLHAPFLGIHTLDIAQLSLYLQQKDKKHARWRFLLQDSLLLETMELQNAKAIYRLGQNLEKWIAEQTRLTIPMLLENILYDSGIVAHILKSETQIWDMQVLNTFFDFLKEECEKQPRLSLRELLLIIEKMNKEHIAINIQKVVRNENGVRFYTAFSAKGHEFEHVFVVGLTKRYWEEKTGGNRGFALPDTLTLTREKDGESDNTQEVARRLFYVAMTRARQHLHISYARQDNKEKELEPSRFIGEISREDERSRISLDDQSVLSHIAESFLPDPPVRIEIAKKELLEKRLERFELSVSAMNKYLSCQLAFYYEYVLQVPAAKSDALAFGSAVHYALEHLFKRMIDDPAKAFPAKEDVLQLFHASMRRNEDAFTALQYARRKEMGEQILGEYYDQYVLQFNKVVLLEYNVKNVTVEGVPIKGKIDKIEFDGKNCIVVDYKTGSPEYATGNQLRGPGDDNPDGGDYWRQMVFYKILLDNFYKSRDWNTTGGMFDFIEKNKKGDFVRFFVPMDDASVRTVKEQIKTVYRQIMNHEFDTGCGKETCQWCNFVKDFELIRPVPEEEL